MNLEHKAKAKAKDKDKTKVKNIGKNEGIMKIQNDLQILSNDFKEGEMQMNYIRNNIVASAKKDRIAKEGNNTIHSVRRILSPSKKLR